MLLSTSFLPPFPFVVAEARSNLAQLFGVLDEHFHIVDEALIFLVLRLAVLQLTYLCQQVRVVTDVEFLTEGLEDLLLLRIATNRFLSLALLVLTSRTKASLTVCGNSGTSA